MGNKNRRKLMRKARRRQRRKLRRYRATRDYQYNIRPLQVKIWACIADISVNIANLQPYLEQFEL